MQQFEIKGGAKLSGSIAVRGAKNAALKIVPATLLSDEPSSITNFPFIEDTRRMLELYQALGGSVFVHEKKNQVGVNPRGIKTHVLDELLVRKVRTSILFAGPLLARFGKVEMYHPGGCVLGKRPIDLFLDGFTAFGASIYHQDNKIVIQGSLKGARIFFPKITVTGTEAMMMTAVLAKGRTVLENCAIEPEIPALAQYLNQCGAKISGAGTSTIIIEGVKRIYGGTFQVIPDRIETGTFVMMGLVTGSEITVTKCNPAHLGAVLPVLRKAGARLEIGKNYITTKKSRLQAYSIVTHEYPGFATDLQPPYTLLMTQAQGTALIHEPIFEGRLFFTDQLSTMGADIIMCDPHRVVVQGPTNLQAKKITSPDIRAGITMVLAGMIANGTTIIDNIYQIDRGYERIEERLRGVGVQIERVDY